MVFEKQVNSRTLLSFHKILLVHLNFHYLLLLRLLPFLHFDKFPKETLDHIYSLSFSDFWFTSSMLLLENDLLWVLIMSLLINLLSLQLQIIQLIKNIKIQLIKLYFIGTSLFVVIEQFVFIIQSLYFISNIIHHLLMDIAIKYIKIIIIFFFLLTSNIRLMALTINSLKHSQNPGQVFIFSHWLYLQTLVLFYIWFNLLFFYIWLTLFFFELLSI